MIIFGCTNAVPVLRLHGSVPMDAGQRAKALAERRRIRGKQPNDPHGVLMQAPVWTDTPVVFDLHTLDYADITTLRAEGTLPHLVSAGAVVFCEEKGVLVLHRRASNSATYPGCLHIIGGGYMPPAHGRENDGTSLLNTVRREAFEESRASLVWRDLPPGLLAQEVDTGFVQYVLLGVNIPAADAERLEHSPEGTITLVPFGELLHRLQRPDSPDPQTQSTGWTPTGRAHVLAWLALGAPGSVRPLRFATLSAAEVFNAVIP